MGKLKNNSKGFTAVEGLLIILILVVIGAVGYMVYHNNHKTKTASITTTSNSKPTTTKTTSTSTSTQQINLSQYTYNDISFSYPKTWTLKTFSTPSGDELSLSSIASFDEGAAETTNNTQYNNNDVLVIQMQNITSSYYNNSGGPFGSGNYLVSGNLSVNGSSNDCLVGYSNNGQAGSPANLFNIEVFSSCDTSKGTGVPFLATSTGKYFSLDIEKANQNNANTVPISTTSNDYSTIQTIIQSMKF